MVLFQSYLPLLLKQCEHWCVHFKFGVIDKGYKLQGGPHEVLHPVTPVLRGRIPHVLPKVNCFTPKDQNISPVFGKRQGLAPPAKAPEQPRQHSAHSFILLRPTDHTQALRPMPPVFHSTRV